MTAETMTRKVKKGDKGLGMATSSVLTLRVPTAVKATYEQQARELGISLGDYVRGLMLINDNRMVA